MFIYSFDYHAYQLEQGCCDKNIIDLSHPEISNDTQYRKEHGITNPGCKYLKDTLGRTDDFVFVLPTFGKGLVNRLLT
jgi:hypothetical protein